MTLRDTTPTPAAPTNDETGPTGELPHARAIIAITFMILAAFVLVTFWVLTADEESGIEAATKGAVIQTWNNLAIGAGAFWLGSSLAGKMGSGGRKQ